MPNPLIAKLAGHADLSPEDATALEGLCSDVKIAQAGEDLVQEGGRPDEVFIMLDGWALRYKLLSDGKRQVMAYLLPGDMSDPRGFILREMDHSIGLLSDAKHARVTKEKMTKVIAEHPAVARALWWSTLQAEAISREWIVNIGQRDAYARIAHLFAELHARLDAVGLTEDCGFEMPPTQTILADTVALTPVHVNRVLRQMRADGLIVLKDRRLTIPDVHRLRDLAGFKSNYLHIDRREAIAS